MTEGERMDWRSAGDGVRPGVAALPDSAGEIGESEGVALDWVGMHGIAMPLMFSPGLVAPASASIDAWVDLADTRARGIHMSRMYSVLQSQLANRLASTGVLRGVLDSMLESQSTLATRAQVDIRGDLLLQRRALVSELAGWQRYPLVLRARRSHSVCEFEAEWRVGYSSTCPGSAALARRAQADAFSGRFGPGRALVSDVAAWLASPAGAVATAHAQRSEARVRIRLADGTEWPDWVAIVDRCEAALGTPLQTAVKRVDEQEFAVRNAENLMFCEDAARRLHAAFAHAPEWFDFDIRVAHFESLHAHDAVARASRSGDYRTLAIAD